MRLVIALSTTTMILVLRSEDVNTCVDLAGWRMNRCDDALIAGSLEIVQA